MQTLTRNPIVTGGCRRDLRLGGRQYASAGYLTDGTPVCVMGGRTQSGGIDHEGYLVEYAGECAAAHPYQNGPHPFETTAIWYCPSSWTRGRKAVLAELSAQEAEHAGLDPEVKIPTDSYFVFGSGDMSVYVSGTLPEKPEEDFGHNGFWGTMGIRCLLSEIPPDTTVTVESNPGGTLTVVRPL